MGGCACGGRRRARGCGVGAWGRRARRRRRQCRTRRPRPSTLRRTPRRPSRSPPRRTTRALGAPRGPRARPASLLLVAAWLAGIAADPACPREPPAAQVVCASCHPYESAREHSLRAIRESLLAKLGFAQAPNTTGRQLPAVPADLMERFELLPPPPGVQADAPAASRAFVTHTERDDFLARTDNVLVFARYKDWLCHRGSVRPESPIVAVNGRPCYGDLKTLGCYTCRRYSPKLVYRVH